MYIKRKLEDTIYTYLDKREIIAVIGPRQAGKTTVLQRIQLGLKNSIFLNFEDRDELALFEEDIKAFAKKYSPYRYIFIDEFQYSKSGGKNLKYLYDAYPELKIIISGSSSVDLTIHAIRYLVGRIFVFNLYQLDFEEYLRFKDPGLSRVYKEYKKTFYIQKGLTGFPSIAKSVSNQLNKLLKEFILWGGYPRVVVSQDEEEKKVVLKNIYNTYFLRDIRDILGLVDDFRLAKLIKAIASQIGQLVSYNELGITAEYDYLTLKKYLNILEKTYICSPLKPYYLNKRKEITKNPKLYFFDTGLRNYVIGDFAEVENRSDKGFLYENFIWEQCLKQEIKCNFWRKKTKEEVDFILETGGRNIPLESKSESKAEKIPKPIKTFINDYKTDLAIVLNAGILKKTRVGKTEVYFLPHWII